MSTRIRGLSRADLTHGIVQVSLDLTTIDDALRMSAIAVEAGADWLEIGTPLTMAEGRRAVTALREEYPNHPLIADLKIMDGGYGEAKMYAEAGADAVVVMGRAHDATVQRVCEAGVDFGILVMGDDMGADDRGAGAGGLGAPGGGGGEGRGSSGCWDGSSPHRPRSPKHASGTRSLSPHRSARHCGGHNRAGAGCRWSEH